MWSHLAAYNTMLTLRWESRAKDSNIYNKQTKSWITTLSVPIRILNYLQYLHTGSNLKLGFGTYKNQGLSSLVLNANSTQKSENIFERAARWLLCWNDNSVPLGDGCRYQKPERMVERPMLFGVKACHLQLLISSKVGRWYAHLEKDCLKKVEVNKTSIATTYKYHRGSLSHSINLIPKVNLPKIFKRKQPGHHSSGDAFQC